MSEEHLKSSDHAQHNCSCHKTTTAVQSLDELDFNRGIWSAGKKRLMRMTQKNTSSNHLFDYPAALYNDLERLQMLIDRGDVNRRDNSCYTALHYAARKNHFEACERLLTSGADVNAQTNGGVTPLHRACSMGIKNIYVVIKYKNTLSQLTNIISAPRRL